MVIFTHNHFYKTCGSGTIDTCMPPLKSVAVLHYSASDSQRQVKFTASQTYILTPSMLWQFKSSSQRIPRIESTPKNETFTPQKIYSYLCHEIFMCGMSTTVKSSTYYLDSKDLLRLFKDLMLLWNHAVST